MTIPWRDENLRNTRVDCDGVGHLCKTLSFCSVVCFFFSDTRVDRANATFYLQESPWGRPREIWHFICSSTTCRNDHAAKLRLYAALGSARRDFVSYKIVRTYLPETHVLLFTNKCADRGSPVMPQVKVSALRLLSYPLAMIAYGAINQVRRFDGSNIRLWISSTL